MIADVKTYPAMKDAGVPLLGAMPEHWETQKLRNVLRRVSERNRPDLPLLSVVREKGVIVRDISEMKENPNFIPDDLSNYRVVRSGQFAMNKMKAWQGSYGVSKCDGIVSPAYYVFDVAGVGERFFHRAIRSKAYVPFFMRASDGVRIGQWDLAPARLKEIPFFVPPVPEQSAIVRFTDWMERRIGRLISARQKRIKLLEEYKQALIHRAVTGKIDVRTGRAYPSYRPSGAEWLGDVPEHWDVRRCRYLFREVNRRSVDGSEERLSMSQRSGLIPSHLVENRTLVSESDAGGKLCEPGDLVLNRLKAHLGVFAMARLPGIVSPDYTVLRPVNPEGAAYFELVLRSPACRQELRTRAKGIVEGFWRLYTDDFYEIRLPTPNPSERCAITDRIQNASSAIEKVTEGTEREIAFLRELRSRLIADVVTGKLDVREVAATLAEEAEGAEMEKTIDDEALVERESLAEGEPERASEETVA